MLSEIADDLVRQSAASASGRSFSSSVIRAIRWGYLEHPGSVMLDSTNALRSKT